MSLRYVVVLRLGQLVTLMAGRGLAATEPRVAQMWMIKVLVLVLVAVAGLAACDDKPDSRTIKVLQYNVQGGIRDLNTAGDGEGSADDDDYRFVDILARRIAEEKPQIVTLNEI